MHGIRRAENQASEQRSDPASGQMAERMLITLSIQPSEHIDLPGWLTHELPFSEFTGSVATSADGVMPTRPAPG